MKKFTSSLDMTSKVVTWGIFGLVLVLTFIAFSVSKSTGDGAQTIFVALIGPVLLAVILVAMYGLKPTAIIVNSDGMIIDRKIKPVSIPFSEIESVRIIQEGEMGFTFRTFGDGGVFGYIGLFYNRRYGNMMWYCTQRENYVLIEKINGKKVVITPDDPAAFVQELGRTPVKTFGVLSQTAT